MTFYIDKGRDGFASGLIAFGWAKIVQEVADRNFTPNGYSLRIEDKGAYYEMECSPELTREMFAYSGHQIQPAPLIKTEEKAKKSTEETEDEGELGVDVGGEADGTSRSKRAVKAKPPLPDGYRVVDYGKHKEQNTRYFEFKRANPSAPADQLPEPPDVQWDTYRAINPAALPGYNNLLLDWHAA